MPMNRRDYPADWEQISHAIRFGRAGGRCECEGECGRDHDGRCTARHRQQVLSGADEETGEPLRCYDVILTTAHLWRGPCDCDHKCGKPSHLKAMCQACHLSYDRPHHLRRAAETRRRKKEMEELF